MDTFLEDIAYVWLYIIFIFELIKMASCHPFSEANSSPAYSLRVPWERSLLG